MVYWSTIHPDDTEVRFCKGLLLLTAGPFAFHVLMWSHIQNKIGLVDKYSLMNVCDSQSVTEVSAWG
jgi:hypothetical protein